MNDRSSTLPPDELGDAIQAFMEGMLPPDGVARLDSLLRESDTACWLYIQYMHLNAGLTWDRDLSANEEHTRKTEGLGAAEFWGHSRSNSSGDDVIEPVVAACFPNERHSTIASKFPLGDWGLSYVAATAIIGLLLLGAWMHKVAFNHNVAFVDNNQMTTDSGELSGEQPAPVYIGRITAMVDCTWSNPETEPFAGSAVPLGRQYALASGIMEITYKSGAKVILKGPCTYRVESPTGGYLAVGKLTARIGERGERREKGSRSKVQGSKFVSLATSHQPLATNSSSLIPHPSSLFSVRTPTAVVTDLSTEFGVEVDGNGDTVSYVFKGSIIVEIVAGDSGSIDSTRQRVVLRQGEAAKVVKDAAGPRMVLGSRVGDVPQFVQIIPEPSQLSGHTFAIDGAVFRDDFAGQSLDAAKWNVVLADDGSVSVADGTATIRSDVSPADGHILIQSAGELNFGNSADDWWLEIRFKIEGGLASGFKNPRDWIIIAGGRGAINQFTVRGFDLRAMQRGMVDSDTYDLGWCGWDNVDRLRFAVALTRGLKKGRFYTAAIHRKPDGTADIYLDGQLIASKQLIADENPDWLLCGDRSTAVGGSQVVDYVKIGLPTSESNKIKASDKNSQGEILPMKQ